ncbi:GvpL/GvpF family gas vesicle protein [Nocardioides sp. YIM 152315]|uniref:GvpL/GvpF family gas vesicle protein n=1 Tax=Nocardioides sp. YIM 152315 TaxID=3031760 RepID=UPI0023D98B53|nr:GvpL/GvpF family gas vesicle protein [Nocardioides sp. YIM 152315]MDF1602517.1 GvpL/GvpF family gas vesicle protein [Nocardioides sp. YIM 152315]
MSAGHVTDDTTRSEVEVGTDRALFVYGVVRAADTRGGAPELTGLDGAPVGFVVDGPLAAAVTPVSLDRPPGRRAELLAYQSVLDVLAEAGPVAPVRFGSVLADGQSVVEELLGPRQEGFVAFLDQLDGKRQYNLRATYVEEAVLADLVATEPEIRQLRDYTKDLPEHAGYGERARLGELVYHAMQDRSSFDADVLLDAVVPLAVAHLVRTPPSATQVLDVALLVEEARAEALVAALEDLAEAVHERIRMRLVGPLAAYDFVGEAGWG